MIGAGMAGLASARTLAEAGLRVALLEARERAGGRIYTVASQISELPIELGAEFIHGLPEELIELVDEAGLTRFELEGESRCFRGAGPVGPCGEQLGVHQLFGQLGEFAAADMSFAEWVRQSGADPEAAAWATNYVEGFNAAEADRIGVLSLIEQQGAEDAISGDRMFRVVEGYARVPEFLLRRFLDAGGQYFSSTPVASVTWRAGRAEVASGTGQSFSARAAIVTLPLGVLQARHVAFHPEPLGMLRLADSLAMGLALRVVYEFDVDFWQRLKVLNDLSFLFTPDLTPPTWWTTHPRAGATLTGWLAGTKAKGWTAAKMSLSGADTLRTILGDVGEGLVAHHTHDWQADPRSLGAYTYVPPGAIAASKQMTDPLEQTLFFAGEHTDTTGSWGTVHAALRSGYRAARQLLSQN